MLTALGSRCQQEKEVFSMTQAAGLASGSRPVGHTPLPGAGARAAAPVAIRGVGPAAPNARSTAGPVRQTRSLAGTCVRLQRSGGTTLGPQALLAAATPGRPDSPDQRLRP